MKFRFSPPLKNIKIKRKKRKKALVLKAQCAPRIRKEINLCYPELSTPTRHRFYLLKQKIKKLFFKVATVLKRIMHKKSAPPRVPPRTLLGIFSGVSIICLVAATTIIYSLFLSYNAPYTTVTIPNFLSLNESEATALSPEIFEYEIECKSNPHKPSKAVTGQIPSADITRKLYRGEKIKIRLIINVDQPTFTIPNFYNKSARETVIKLKSAGINVHITRQHSNTVSAGNVISCSPSVGTILSTGDTVTLCASLGKKTVYVTIPELLGLDEYEAANKIKSLGLTVGDILYEASEKPVGTVIAQSVAANSELPQKSKISFTLSGGINY